MPFAIASVDRSQLSAVIQRLGAMASEGYLDSSLSLAGGMSVNAYAGEMRKRFISASHGDGTWRPLSIKRIRRRMALGFSPSPEEVRRKAKKAAEAISMAVNATAFPILYVTGALYESLGGGAGSVFAAAKESIAYGTSIRYAAAHQWGYGDNLPARPILALPGPESLQLIADLHAGAIADAISGDTE